MLQRPQTGHSALANGSAQQFSSLASGSRPWAIGCTTSWSKWVWPLGWGGHLGGPLAKCQDIMLGILQFMQGRWWGVRDRKKGNCSATVKYKGTSSTQVWVVPIHFAWSTHGIFPGCFFHLCAVITRRNALLSSTIVHAVPPEPRSRSPTTRP